MSFFQNFQKKHGLYTKLTPLINTRPNAWHVMLYCKGSVRLGRLKFCLSSVGSGRVESCGLNKTQNNLKSTRPDPTQLDPNIRTSVNVFYESTTLCTDHEKSKSQLPTCAPVQTNSMKKLQETNQLIKFRELKYYE